jgi:hypothetical protein
MTKEARIRTYISYSRMIARCYDESHQAYMYYGAEGVTVCERWRESFAAFVEDIGERPLGMTLDRIDGSKPYEPENVRWETHSQQMRNRRLPANSIPSCLCGLCLKCRNRASVARYIARKRGR